MKPLPNDRERQRPIAPDPLIDEIRSIRKALSDQFDNDEDKLCDHLQEIEKQVGDRVVRQLPPARAPAEG